ncbi:hypothetical protein ABZ714_01500 [Streptomyces sp. NPDC006798]|uniref:hypothetical protein n=1 Tax=Streptomyces sp. NPDC006798 TaxID=3155462 RepID=UPI0034036049
MATISFLGPYLLDMKSLIGPQCLPTGGAKTITVGPFEPFDGTVTATAHPGTEAPEGYGHNRTAVWAQETYLQKIPHVQGDLIFFEYVLWVTLTNVGEPTVRYVTLWVSLVKV